MAVNTKDLFVMLATCFEYENEIDTARLRIQERVSDGSASEKR